jgi:hypothetical protein
MALRDHASAFHKAADVIREKAADNIGGFINHLACSIDQVF